MSEWKVTTPIDTFENPANGSVIDIVSMVHVGLPSYYRTIGSYVMARQDEGFEVHFEGIGGSENDLTAPTTPLQALKNKLMLRAIDTRVDTFVAILDGSYAIQSSEGLFYEDSSYSHDMSTAELAKATGLLPSTLRYVSERVTRRRVTRAAQKGPEKLDERVFQIIRGQVKEDRRPKERRRIGDRSNIDMRNAIALGGVDEALEVDQDSKLVLLWGLGHLAGLSAGLTQRGYEQTGRQEVTLALSRAGLEKSLKKDEQALKRLQAKLQRSQPRADFDRFTPSWAQTKKNSRKRLF